MTVYYLRRRKRLLYTGCGVLVFLIVFAAYFQPWYTPLLCVRWPRLKFCSHSSSSGEAFDLLYHLGGNGPWIPRTSDGTKPLPPWCQVEQVHMLSRHAERHPTTNAGNRHLALLAKLRTADNPVKGSLSFLRNWSYFTDPKDFDDLTTSGPFAGTVQAHAAGETLRRQYMHLLPTSSNVSFWSCSSPRDIETAKYFARGFFGKDWTTEDTATLHIIPETPERGGDTLTPGDTCMKYINDRNSGHDQGYAELATWQSIYTKLIGQRLKEEAGGLEFTPLEIYGMMEMCGFEILVRGSSPWCDVFTQEEWYDYEYARDLLHFYRAGPGNQYAGVMGLLWLNATQSLLSNEHERGLFISFAHDGDIIPLITALGILDEETEPKMLLSTRNKKTRKWRTSDVVPMGGRFVFEKVVCNAAEEISGSRRTYIRLLINDGLFDLESVVGGSGLAASATLADFQHWVRTRGEQFGSFREVCGLAQDAPDHITFLHQ